MTKKLYSTIAMFGLFLTLAMVSAKAQSTARINVNVPFDFNIGSELLKAGDYTIKQLTGHSLAITSVDGKSRAIAITASTVIPNGNAAATQERLVFRRYGNEYFLAQVWLVNGGEGSAIIKSKREREISREGQIAGGGSKFTKVEVSTSVR